MAISRSEIDLLRRLSSLTELKDGEYISPHTGEKVSWYYFTSGLGESSVFDYLQSLCISYTRLIEKLDKLATREKNLEFRDKILRGIERISKTYSSKLIGELTEKTKKIFSEYDMKIEKTNISEEKILPVVEKHEEKILPVVDKSDIEEKISETVDDDRPAKRIKKSSRWKRL